MDNPLTQDIVAVAALCRRTHQLCPTDRIEVAVGLWKDPDVVNAGYIVEDLRVRNEGRVGGSSRAADEVSQECNSIRQQLMVVVYHSPARHQQKH